MKPTAFILALAVFAGCRSVHSPAHTDRSAYVPPPVTREQLVGVYEGWDHKGGSYTRLRLDADGSGVLAICYDFDCFEYCSPHHVKWSISTNSLVVTFSPSMGPFYRAEVYAIDWRDGLGEKVRKIVLLENGAEYTKQHVLIREPDAEKARGKAKEQLTKAERFWSEGGDESVLPYFTGTNVSYLSKGKLLHVHPYVNGRKNGRWVDYDAAGNVIVDGIYRNGQPWSGSFHPEKPVLEHRRYLVMKGEDLYSVAIRWGVDLEKLRTENKLTGTALSPGQELDVPVEVYPVFWYENGLRTEHRPIAPSLDPKDRNSTNSNPSRDK